MLVMLAKHISAITLSIWSALQWKEEKLIVKDKVAVVTGGGRGIGKVSALTLAREGANVAIWERVPETLAKTAEEIDSVNRH